MAHRSRRGRINEPASLGVADAGAEIADHHNGVPSDLWRVQMRQALVGHDFAVQEAMLC